MGEFAEDGSPIPVSQWGVKYLTRDPDADDWEVQPDGSIIFICGTPGPGGYGPIKKYFVTPAPGSNLASWIASAK